MSSRTILQALCPFSVQSLGPHSYNLQVWNRLTIRAWDLGKSSAKFLACQLAVVDLPDFNILDRLRLVLRPPSYAFLTAQVWLHAYMGWTCICEHRHVIDFHCARLTQCFTPLCTANVTDLLATVSRSSRPYYRSLSVERRQSLSYSSGAHCVGYHSICFIYLVLTVPFALADP